MHDNVPYIKKKKKSSPIFKYLNGYDLNEFFIQLFKSSGYGLQKSRSA